MGIWQTFSRGICKMKLSLQGIYLLPVIRVELSIENENFGKPTIVNLTTAQYLKNFVMTTMVILTNEIFNFINWNMYGFVRSEYLSEPLFSKWPMHIL